MFRTELTIATAAGQLPRTARVLTMGSCFADSIGARLAAHKVETRVNPFGTVFQPLALARLLRAAAGEEVDWQQHLVQARGRWQSYDLHGSVGADSPVELLQYIQEVVRQTGEFLRNTDLVLLTLGTAWTYRLRETGELVSNCHKQPADLFVRELLTPDEIINALAETHAYLRRINPELRFVLTVSPVRHLKDTLPLNSVSKSVLRVATHIVSDLLPGVAYFPAFELLTDDLRDYRFYAADMLHPSELAEDYIWDKFTRTYFDADFGRFRKEWAAVRQSLGHRPLHEGAPEHRQFLESTREKLEQLSLRKVNVEDELRTVRARLESLPLPAQSAPMAEVEDDEERIDIGEGAVRSAIAAPAAADESLTAEQPRAEQPSRGEGRPPRLSPEEFRAQRAGRPERGRRDGRGKGQAVQPTETEQFQAASFAEADEFAQQPFLTDATADELVPVASATEVTAGTPDAEDEAALEAGRKKKRRSRGGAKRTARKHALRLASEMGLDEGQLPASEAALEAAAGAMAAGADSSAAATQPENAAGSLDAREPREDRRNGRGRGVARVPLFAAAPDATDGANDSTEGADDSGASAESAFDTEQNVLGSSARKNRNRKKKKGNRPVVADSADTDENAAPAEAPRGAIEAVVDQQTLETTRNNDQRNNDRRNNERRGNRDPQQELPVAALQAGDGAGGAEATIPVVLVPATSDMSVANTNLTASVPQAAKPSKRKSRAMVGGRAEKPAFDTPIIPLVDALAVRTQVAGGRLLGTSASLIAPTAPVKPGKAASPKKPAAAKAPAAKVPATKPAATDTAAVAATLPVLAVDAAATPVAKEAPAATSALNGSKPAAKAVSTKTRPKAKAANAAPAVEAVPEPVKPVETQAAVSAAPAQPAAKTATKKAQAKAPVAAVPVAPAVAPASVPIRAKATKAAKPTAKATPAAVAPAAEPIAKPVPKAVSKSESKAVPKPVAPKAKAAAKPTAKEAKASAEPAAAKPATVNKAASKAAAPTAAPAKAPAAKKKAPKKSDS